MEPYTETVTDQRGNTLNAVNVAVYNAAMELATIYSDNGVTTKNNPFETDDLGTVFFYAADGPYTVRMTHTGYNGGVARDIPILLNSSTSTIPVYTVMPDPLPQGFFIVDAGA